MDFENQESYPVGKEDLSSEYNLSFQGEKGNIRTKIERLAGGSTSDVRKGIFISETGERTPIAFKVYNPEPLGSAAESPWRIGPAEAGVLNTNIPGVVKQYDYGWLHGRANGGNIDSILNPANTHLDISPRTLLPSQFTIVEEYLDPEQYIHPPKVWTIVKNGLPTDPYSGATLEGIQKNKELMQSHDLYKKGFRHPRQFGEDLLVSAAWTYFNTKVELQNAGWYVSDFDLSKNFVFDPNNKQWKLYDFGVATPTKEQSAEFVEKLLGKDFQPILEKRKEAIKKAESVRNSTPPDTELLRDALLSELGFHCFTKAFNYKLPNAGSGGQFKPTGEGLTPKLKEFVDWIYDDDNIQSLQDMRDRIGQFAVSKMGGMSNSAEIINNTVGKGFSLYQDLMIRKRL